MRTVQLAPYKPQLDVIRAPSRQQLLRLVGAAMRRGELGAVDVIRQTTTGWAVQVYRLKPAGRARWPLYVGGVAVAILGLAAAGWFLVGPLTALLTMLLPMVAGGMFLRWLLELGTDQGCTITHRRH